jgi:hypothetical protein
MPKTLLEAADAGKVLDLTPGMVRVLVETGRLRPVAITPRGVRLFEPRDVEALARERRERQRQRG